MADYEQQMRAKLKASRERVKQGREMKALKAGAPTLFEIMDGEISLIVNKMTAPEPMPRDEYLSAHGQVVGIRKVRDLIDFKESEESVSVQEVEAITGQLEQFENDKKA